MQCYIAPFLYKLIAEPLLLNVSPVVPIIFQTVFNDVNFNKFWSNSELVIISLVFTLRSLFISKSKLFWRTDVQGTNKLHLSFNFFLFLLSVSCWRSAGELAFASLLFRLSTSKQIPGCSWLVIDLVAAFEWAKCLGKKCVAGRSIVNEAIKTILSQFIFFLRKIFERTKTHRKPKPTNKNENKRTKKQQR